LVTDPAPATATVSIFVPFLNTSNEVAVCPVLDSTTFTPPSAQLLSILACGSEGVLHVPGSVTVAELVAFTVVGLPFDSIQCAAMVNVTVPVWFPG